MPTVVAPRGDSFRIHLMKKRAADRFTGGAKPTKRNKPYIDEEAEDFIVVDTGELGGPIREIGIVGNEESPKLASESAGSDSTQQDGKTAVQTKLQLSGMHSEGLQNARDAFIILESNINTTSSESPKPRSASNSEIIRADAGHMTSRTPMWEQYGILSPYHHNYDPTTPRAHSQVSKVYTPQRPQYSDPIKDLSSRAYHNSMWMSVVTGMFETSRTASDKRRLRDRAAKFIAGREDVELEEDETMRGRKRVYPDVCGAVVDKHSAQGIVAVTAYGSTVQQIDTGQGAIGDPYAELTIEAGQACVIHGSSTVLYYKPREISLPYLAPQPPQSRVAARPGEPSNHQVVKLPSPPEIIIRLQIDEVGRFGGPYDISSWSPEVKTTEFFAWFRSQTGRGNIRGPPLLTFTFKDAMPNRKSYDVRMLNEDDFCWVRKHVLRQSDEAKLYMPGLKDFTVLVTDPGWLASRKGR